MACLLHFPHWSRQIKNSSTPPTTLSIPLAYIWDLRHFLIFSSRTHLSARWWIIKTLSLFRKERRRGGVKEREREEKEKKKKMHWSLPILSSYPAIFAFVLIRRASQLWYSWGALCCPATNLGLAKPQPPCWQDDDIVRLALTTTKGTDGTRTLGAVGGRLQYECVSWKIPWRCRLGVAAYLSSICMR